MMPELRGPLTSEQKIVYGYQNLKPPNLVMFSQGLNSKDHLRSKSLAKEE